MMAEDRIGSIVIWAIIVLAGLVHVARLIGVI